VIGRSRATTVEAIETAVTTLVIFVKLVDVGAMLLKLVEVEDGTISLKWRLSCNRPV